MKLQTRLWILYLKFSSQHLKIRILINKVAFIIRIKKDRQVVRLTKMWDNVEI